MTTNSSPPEPAVIPPALAFGAETTAVRRVRTALERSRAQPRAEQSTAIAALDVTALERTYGGDPANTTVACIGVFRVPMGITWPAWERYRDAAAERFLSMLEREGFVLERVRARPGRYPYHDVLTDREDPGYREMQIVAEGGWPRAERVVVELAPEDVDPIRV